MSKRKAQRAVSVHLELNPDEDRGPQIHLEWRHTGLIVGIEYARQLQADLQAQIAAYDAAPLAVPCKLRDTKRRRLMVGTKYRITNVEGLPEFTVLGGDRTRVYVRHIETNKGFPVGVDNAGWIWERLDS